MPTPFTHLESAQRLLEDPAVPPGIAESLRAELGAFLLGNIAADARNEGGLRREDTHFYSYERPMDDHPWEVMLRQHPALHPAQDAAQRAFLAGYVAHLSMDEWWSLHMLGPHFAGRDWAPRTTRFFYLHILLIHMDERDRDRLAPWQAGGLRAAHPTNWTPFMSDAILCDWRDFIGGQFPPGTSQTLTVFGERIHKTPAELRAVLDSPARMQDDLWAHIKPELLAEVEAGMYAHARAQMMRYWALGPT